MTKTLADQRPTRILAAFKVQPKVPRFPKKTVRLEARGYYIRNNFFFLGIKTSSLVSTLPVSLPRYRGSVNPRQPNMNIYASYNQKQTAPRSRPLPGSPSSHLSSLVQASILFLHLKQNLQSRECRMLEIQVYWQGMIRLSLMGRIMIYDYQLK